MEACQRHKPEKNTALPTQATTPDHPCPTGGHNKYPPPPRGEASPQQTGHRKAGMPPRLRMGMLCPFDALTSLERNDVFVMLKPRKSIMGKINSTHMTRARKLHRHRHMAHAQ